MIKPRLVSYAQNREDVILSGFFDIEKPGFYVDIGAESPTDLSVTKIFYDKGWHGINVEPIKRLYDQLEEARPLDINVNTGVSDQNGKLTFREYEGTGYSTFSPDMQKEHATDKEELVKKYVEYEVPVVTLKRLLDDNNVTSIQFLKIDVEGLEYEVLSGNDWKKYRPEVICIEANHIKKDWRISLKENSYQQVFFDGLNEYYVDTKNKDIKKFDYIDTIIYKEPIVNFKLLEDFQEYDKLVAWLEEGKKNLTVELEATTHKLYELEHRFNDIKSLKKHVRKSVLSRAAKIDQKIISKLDNRQTHSPRAVHNTSDVLSELLAEAKITDTKNFEIYTKAQKNSLILPIYLKGRELSIKSLKKARKAGRRIRKSG